jgi:hypothetical protein
MLVSWSNHSVIIVIEPGKTLKVKRAQFPLYHTAIELDGR